MVEPGSYDKDFTDLLSGSLQTEFAPLTLGVSFDVKYLVFRTDFQHISNIQ